jgi:Family of unknown function (DUF6352)
MQDPWPSAGYADLARDDRGWQVPTDAWWRSQFARPELAPVDESCAAERRLHAALQVDPARPVAPAELERIADPDAQQNYRVFLHFRDRVLQAGSIEAAYVGLFHGAGVDIAPLFVDLLAQAILRHLLDASDDAFEWRAAQMLFRPQRCTRIDGRLVAGDRATLDLLNETGGYGELGRLLAAAGAAPRAVQLEVLSTDNAAAYFAEAERHRFLLDLTQEVERDLGHGVGLRLANAHSGQKALARVLERWVAHLLGVQVRIRPLARIDDAQWRWHVGLDATASALLNDLYEGREVDDQRLQGVTGLFRLDFIAAADVRPDVAGRPVYLGAAMDRDGLMRLKPQNLLLNLPLAGRS